MKLKVSEIKFQGNQISTKSIIKQKPIISYAKLANEIDFE